MGITQEEFGKLFRSALDEAVVIAEQHNQVKLPREFEIALYGLGFSGDIMEVEDAIEFLYLGEDLFVYLVDVAAFGASESKTRFFVRPSGHPPKNSFEETWNNIAGKGPFKQIISLQFKTLKE